MVPGVDGSKRAIRILGVGSTLTFAGCIESPAAAESSQSAAALAVLAASGRCDEPVTLLPPEGPLPVPRPGLRVPAGRQLVARWYDAKIYSEPKLESVVVGYGRRGHLVGVRDVVPGTGCPSEAWYAFDGGGFGCATRDFRQVGAGIVSPVPVVDEPLPYRYAKVVNEGAQRFKRLPEGGVLEDGKAMTGAYFLTVVETVEHDGMTFHRTDWGDYVRAQDVELLAPPPYTGELLSGTDALPLAFVYAEQAELLCECGGETRPCGSAQRMTRFEAGSRKTIDGQEYLLAGEDAWIARSAVRVVQRIPRPASVPPNERWIHVDLAEQAVVAYDGDTPVFTTLVSTGKAGHETPTGTWRIERKHVSVTMSGPDEVKGTYTVSEVPWTLYYDGAYALHGAYWHSAFGAVRSHGCTNLPPADARWLFIWSGGVPPGWHAQSNAPGPYVHVTDAS